MRNERIIGQSSIWLEVIDQVSLLAAIDRPILVLGERGTGKELVAERLHYLSSRWDQPLIKVNCAAFTDSLLESELFGYEPGAFTGATRTHKGRFERAQGGTLFLDELGTMSPRVQEKILRVIEYGEFERLGGQKTLSVDVRIVAATNADLKTMVEEGEFRGDLLDRLAFDVVWLPPLRVRREDIAELAEFFAVRMCHELGHSLFPGFSEGALEQLAQYPWPGNVRELKNVVERSVYRWGDREEVIDTVVIDPFASIKAATELSLSPVDTPKPSPESSPEPSLESIRPSIASPLSFKEATTVFERELLLSAMADNQYHQGKAAQQLGLSYDQFRGLYRKYDLGVANEN